MDDREEFTAADFDRWAKWFEESWVENDHQRATIAALRIASAVMRPGVIEAVLGDLDATTEGEAAAIRSALTDAKP